MRRSRFVAGAPEVPGVPDTPPDIVTWMFRRRRRIPPEVFEQAKANPNGSVAEIAQGWRRDGAIPPGAILGAWSVDAAGKPGEYHVNPNYDPALPPPDPPFSN